jgi:hypothetical protein
MHEPCSKSTAVATTSWYKTTRDWFAPTSVLTYLYSLTRSCWNSLLDYVATVKANTEGHSHSAGMLDLRVYESISYCEPNGVCV